MSEYHSLSEALINKHWPNLVMPKISGHVLERQKAELIEQLSATDTCLIVHYYVDAHLHDVARASGGMVGDSLAMAAFGCKQPQQNLLVCGVRFMAESAKLLSSEKTVWLPALDATCSLDIGCEIEAFSNWCDAHPERTVVVYANTSAAVKARADWVVTSSNALAIVSHLRDQGEAILWAPDRHLGGYIQNQTGADMLLWDSQCIVHDEFKSILLERMKKERPEAVVLAHPESPASVVALADVVGSTQQMLDAAKTSNAQSFIVATDEGLIPAMRHAVPDKDFMVAPSGGSGATCRACGHCPWMAQNSVARALAAIGDHSKSIHIDPAVQEGACRSIERMLNFRAKVSQS